MATERLLRDRGHWWTRNLTPGAKVYGERLIRVRGKEYRNWAARRSKLAAYLEKGGRGFDLQGGESVLYLGAASGTTVSHVSDLLPTGRIWAVEFSARPFRDLLRLASARPNILPILSDAHDPDAYQAWMERPVDLVVQDIAQRDQVEIFRKNTERFLRPGGRGLLSVKARSINVATAPRKIYQQVQRDLATAGVKVQEAVELDPFETDHALFSVAR